MSDKIVVKIDKAIVEANPKLQQALDKLSKAGDNFSVKCRDFKRVVTGLIQTIEDFSDVSQTRDYSNEHFETEEYFFGEERLLEEEESVRLRNLQYKIILDSMGRKA